MVIIGLIVFFGIIGGSNRNERADQSASTPMTQSNTTQPSPTHSIPNQASKPNASWHLVGTFSGSGIQNTSPFVIRGSQWRIDWSENVASPSFVSFCLNYGPCNASAYVYNVGKMQGDWTDQVEMSTVTSTANGIAYEYSGSGNYYLSFITNGPQWKVEVEDYY